MTTNLATRPPTLPAPPAPTGGALRPLARYWIALAITGGLLAMVVIGFTVLQSPYYTFSPGHSFDTSDLVSVGGGQPTYAPDGDIFFLTVGIRRESVLGAARDWADRDVDLIAEQGVLQGRTDEENRAVQAAAMSQSEKDAIAVALDRLGIPRTPTGTGAVVRRVIEDTPADGVLGVADVITAVDGQPVATVDDLTTYLTLPGQAVVLDVDGYDGQHRQESVVLAPRPDDPTHGFLGIEPETRDFDPGAPFPISIDSGRVGGPSAGLAFTLSILDVLTEGELTGGRRIAVTGTIGRDGTVGVVGGVAQKSAAAADSGAEVMIVPTGEEAAAERLGYDLEIIGVADLEEALAALQAVGGDPLPAPSPA